MVELNAKLIVMRVHSRMTGKSEVEKIPNDIEKLLTNDLWKQARSENDEPYERWQDFRADKGPYGLGVNDPQILFQICINHFAVLTKLRQAEKGQEGGDKRSENITCDNITGAKTGTSRAYTLSRLERDRPDLFEQVCAGELSANAAAIEAGWRKKPTPLDQLRKAWTNATKQQRNKFMKEMQLCHQKNSAG